jgi:hypothetical protein
MNENCVCGHHWTMHGEMVSKDHLNPCTEEGCSCNNYDESQCQWIEIDYSNIDTLPAPGLEVLVSWFDKVSIGHIITNASGDIKWYPNTFRKPTCWFSYPAPPMPKEPQKEEEIVMDEKHEQPTTPIGV